MAVMVAGVLSACSTTKVNNLAYFKNASPEAVGALPQGQSPDIRLVVDDELVITISSQVPEATAMFNSPLANNANRGNTSMTSSPRLTTYIVDRDGNITMPVIGKLNVVGRTTQEVEEMVRQQVSQVVKDCYVKVQLAGFYVNVMGEVKTPGRILVNSERFTVLDALAQCGDLTEYAERGAVMVVREENGVKKSYRLDLADTSIFASPVYYLQQNDVVYVEPNKIKIDNSRYNTNNAFKLSVISTIVSAASVIASLVIALTVKR